MKKTISVFLIFVTIFSMFCITVSAATDTNLDMNVYGLYLSGEGDCSLIESDGEWLLIDTGLSNVSNELLLKLKSYGIEELSVLISHLHSDHTGGFEALANSNIKINSLYLPDVSLTPYDTNTEYKHNALQSKARANNPYVEIKSLKKGDSFGFADIQANVLGPVNNFSPEDYLEDESQTKLDHYVNCRSLTVKFVCGETSFISAGDIESQEELALVDEYKGTDALDADILKLSHHALYTSNTTEFLEAVSPNYSYALNSNKTIVEGSNYRKYYSSCKNAAVYGPVYLVGDEKLDFAAKVQNGKISIYKGNTKLSGLVELAGGDGTVVKTYKYYITGGAVKEGVYTIGGKKYYVKNGGQIQQPFYSFNLGKYVYKYEPVENGDVRYFDQNAVMYTGFHKIGDYTYYFDTQTGVMLRGDDSYTPILIGDKKYGVKTNGVIYNYAAKSGAWKKYGNNYRYFDKNGVMQTGWITVGSKKYYMDTKTGLRTLGLKKISGKYYYFVEKDSAGYLYNSGWKKFGSKYRYFDKNGVMKTGWLTIGNKKYYLNKESGYREVGFKKISGKYYYFVEKDNKAYMYNSGWKKFGSKYRYFDKKGVMKTGWLTVGKKKYYLNKTNGYRTVGLKKIGSKTYYFEEKKNSAYMVTGWKKFGSKKRYFDSKGVMAVGKKKIGGRTYKFDKKGYLKK